MAEQENTGGEASVGVKVKDAADDSELEAEEVIGKLYVNPEDKKADDVLVRKKNKMDEKEKAEIIGELLDIVNGRSNCDLTGINLDKLPSAQWIEMCAKYIDPPSVEEFLTEEFQNQSAIEMSSTSRSFFAELERKRKDPKFVEKRRKEIRSEIDSFKNRFSHKFV